MIPKPIDNAMNDGRIMIPLKYPPKAMGHTFTEYWQNIKEEHWTMMLDEAKIKATGE